MTIANRSSLTRTLGSAIAAIAFVALISGAAIFTTIRQVDTARAARARSIEINRQLDAFWAAMLNQETGTRGFLITGDDSSLEPYREARPTLNGIVASLRNLLGDDPRLTAVIDAARSWQQQDGEIVAHSAENPALREEALRIERGGLGKSLFDNLRQKIDAIEDEQSAELDRQDKIVARARANTNIALLTGSALVAFICLAVGLAINRLVAKPLVALADVMHRLSQRDLTAQVVGTDKLNEVGAMARAVQMFKSSLVELDRTSLLRATANTLPALVGFIGRDHRIGFLNDEFGRWFDLPDDDVAALSGRELSEVFPKSSFPGADQALGEALRGTEMTFEHRMLRSGLGPRDLQAVYRPHRSAAGDVTGAVTLLTDITDHKTLEKQLAQHTRELARSNEELEQFAYVASHDLKAPLRGIDNLVTWIEEDLTDSLTGDTRTNMDLLKSRVRRLESLLDDLLAYSRAGRTGTTLEAVDTRQLVSELVELVAPPEGFNVIVNDTLPTIRAMKSPMMQVFQNLISNAIKHHDHPATGHIWVDAGASGAFFEFIVSDDGPGVLPQYRERVFGMFQTLKPRDEVEGSGMGLAIVRKLAESQGGKVWLTDRADGRGLSVHVTWPKR
jgi:signal transduction histidine kinase/CHASE3 domain sensor protein